MNAAQVHRGPDDEGTYHDPEGRITLGARRLSIIDLERGHQPLSNEDGTIWAVLNGEIYNSTPLAERLRRHGHEFRSRADTETLVHLYERYGDDLVHAIEGMYAFAIWDERLGKLLLGRDRFGQKPLFIRRHAGQIEFASELTALVRGLERTPELNLEAIDAFIVLGYVPGPDTMLEGIEQLPPGSVLTWQSASTKERISSYWSPQRSPYAGVEREDELAAETVRLLERAVADTLIADVPVGVFLSGGVDSTLLATLASGTMRQAPPTFTVGYDVGAVSELAQARKVARDLKTDHFELVIDQADAAARVPKVLRSLDQPLADPAVIPLHAVSEFAREQVTVAICGEGADEIFGGYPRYRWLLRSTQLERIVPRRYAAISARALAFAPFGPRARRLANVVGPQTTLERHLDWVTADRRHGRPGLYGPRLAARAHSDVALRSLESQLNGYLDEVGADAFMQLDQRHWLPDDVLFKVDRAGMLNSLEIRAPYLARDVAEFANSVAAGTHLAGRGKALLRAALGKVLPNEGVRRRKIAFRVPGEEWLRGPLREVLDQRVCRGALVSEGLIDADFIAATVREHAAGLNRTPILWPLMSLGLWLDRYIGTSEL